MLKYSSSAFMICTSCLTTWRLVPESLAPPRVMPKPTKRVVERSSCSTGVRLTNIGAGSGVPSCMTFDARCITPMSFHTPCDWSASAGWCSYASTTMYLPPLMAVCSSEPNSATIWKAFWPQFAVHSGEPLGLISESSVQWPAVRMVWGPMSSPVQLALP